MAIAEQVTQDTLLDGRVSLRQPAAGYRAAIDPVLLAAAVPAQPGDRVLDVGAGVGAAALCLAQRVENIRVTGIEVQRELVRLAGENVMLNGLEDHVRILVGDIERPPPRLEPRSYEHVMANPPHIEAGQGRVSPEPAKAVANFEGAGGLAAWIGFCLGMARQQGSITLIHRADRLVEVLDLLAGKAGEFVVFPLWAKDPFDEAGASSAKRVIVRARIGSNAPLRLAGGLVLHHPDGRYTDAAERVLRMGGTLAI